MKMPRSSGVRCIGTICSRKCHPEGNPEGSCFASEDRFFAGTLRMTVISRALSPEHHPCAGGLFWPVTGLDLVCAERPNFREVKPGAVGLKVAGVGPARFCMTVAVKVILPSRDASGRLSAVDKSVAKVIS